MILLSQNYIDSTWCGQELAHFIRAHSADPENPTDVYVVELFPYERLTSCSAEHPAPAQTADSREVLVSAARRVRRRAWRAIRLPGM